MSDFLKWAFDDKTADWVSVCIGLIWVGLFVTWFIAVIALESLALFFAPFAIAAYAVWREYQRSKGDA